MEIATAIEFARSSPQSVFTTIRRSGRPQLSNVLHHVFEDRSIGVSITAERAKYRNLRREPWAALHVTRSDFYAYVVIEGQVALSAVAADIDDPAVDSLVDYYRALRGEHDDWPAYRRAMVAEQRVLARLTATHAYGMVG
jgi:PPOX class probable F420-dependent enzyme